MFNQTRGTRCAQCTIQSEEYQECSKVEITEIAFTFPVSPPAPRGGRTRRPREVAEDVVRPAPVRQVAAVPRRHQHCQLVVHVQ
eukprot:gene6033-biopygen11818